jgi:hypothetical protein
MAQDTSKERRAYADSLSNSNLLAALKQRKTDTQTATNAVKLDTNKTPSPPVPRKPEE